MSQSSCNRKSYPVSLLDYRLPPELIAQEPLADRAASRMMHVDRTSGAIAHRDFRDLPALLRPGDLLVLNDSKVIPGRIRGRKLSGGAVELVVLKELPGRRFSVIAEVRGGMREGERYLLANGFLVAVEWVEQGGPRGIVRAESYLPDPASGDLFSLSDFAGARELSDDEFLMRFYQGGEIPTPPYIKWKLDDPDRYQTVYARERGSAAAPTAGLHFTDEMLARLSGQGVEIQKVTLHVGIGTFLPVRVDDLSKHTMHAEQFELTESAAAPIAGAKREGRRIIAVGTTVGRTLETVFAKNNLNSDGDPQILSGESSIFIYPGYEFHTVSVMLTNFHLPRSTLLAMVYAFGGRELVRSAYTEAIKEKYRFYSFGDCMLIE